MDLLSPELSLELLNNILEDEEIFYGLEILEILKVLIKQYNTVNLENALFFLLTEDKQRFKKSQDRDIKQLFGNCPYQQIQNMVEWSEKLKSVIPVKYFNMISKFNAEIDRSKLSNEIGVIIRFDVPKPEKFFIEKFSEQNGSANDRNESFCSKFSMQFEPKTTKIASERVSDWLKSEFDLYKHNISHLTWENFYDYIITTLSTKTSPEDLQNELFEMLGFECFDLIQKIIEKRDAILNDILIKPTVKFEANDEFELSKTLKKIAVIKEKTPALSSQVTVQSEEEKLLEKQKRRLQKKINKNIHKKGVPEEQFSNYSQIETNIQKVSHEPLFHPVANLNLPEYTHVHDEQKEIHQKAVICGKPVSIPFDAKRVSNKIYEEVSIPSKGLAEKKVENIKVQNLDCIGKMVFNNIETFNLIQSEVFPVAYCSNENMLISAPTGAGKTNIALMTVVHQIKNFIEDNVIQLHKFKIVYVCPMKALAAEMANNFAKKLSCLGIVVKELTGDMQLTKKEIMETQMLIVTPEKWDIITRKGTADVELTSLLKLLIIDEIHLLNTDRGPVIEALVARTLRQVLSSQNMIRIVGLSATLPNYTDVAQFLRVDVEIGLFYFDGRYRSVPLEQTFIGVKASKTDVLNKLMNEICFEKLLNLLKKGHQVRKVMVFVNARNETVRTANFFKEMATQTNSLKYFEPENTIKVKKAAWKSSNVLNRTIEDLISFGLGIHHAGMLRVHRNVVEKCFLDGTIKCLVCTATLAWGVNLPAHAVIIKGTSIYDSKRSSFVDMDILDVLQIFGRAGRPQYDTSGEAFIITAEEKLSHYLRALTNQLPIESKLLEALPDHLNAEIVLGTVASIQEAVEWLTYTYFYRRIRTNPLVYGLTYTDLNNDPQLRENLLIRANNVAIALDKAHMIRYKANTGELTATNFGRTASHYYINYDTMIIFKEMITEFMQESDILHMMCFSGEFNQIQVRPEELEELDMLKIKYCEYPSSPVEDPSGKINVLMQTYLSRGTIKSSSLASDMMYISQNVVRIARALFDIALNSSQAYLPSKCLIVAQMFEKQTWVTDTPLRQFPGIPTTTLDEIENRNIDFLEFRDMTIKQVQQAINNYRLAEHVKRCAEAFPLLDVESAIFPITRGVIRVKLLLTPNFRWFDKFHGKACEVFWIWVENPDNNEMYHWESFTITKKACISKEPLELIFTIQLFEPRPPQYLIHIRNDRWLNADVVYPLSFKDLQLPDSYTPHTDLLELTPLSVSALNNKNYQKMYKFSHFNPVQTQMFHCLYHTDNNVLLGAPTGSGKTIAAEICIFRLFNNSPELKTVYIAPLKALVRERVDDWKNRFTKILGKQVVELTGDVTPSTQITKEADIIITTPEKWDGISRGWQNRSYIRDVGLLIIDEIHLLGEDRGPILEVIVSRTNFISDKTGKKLRIVGLSTAMANAGDLANWLQIKGMGLYNFRPSVRPVPLEVHISGFPGKHYCPRMISMNRPTYQAIRQHAPDSPALVFCSSRKQTRLTASDLINYLATDADPKQWLNCSVEDIEMIVASIGDVNLKHFLSFGIGIHHAGLQERDRKTVEELFVNQKIQVLIATSTLAWGVNFPAHLVVIKGTEYYDGRTKRYVDFPITDVLQMMGRAGRPQFDTSGVACVFVHDLKKNFYKKFLYEPFPIESNLLQVLPDHINAEISADTIGSKKNLMEYITWTYFFRRLMQNPTYYNLPEVEPSAVHQYLSELVDAVVSKLVESNCVSVTVDENNCYYEATFFGHIASFYYLSHNTMAYFQNYLKRNNNIEELIKILCNSEEYSLFPVRHNEDLINEALIRDLGLEIPNCQLDAPSVKVYLLIQAYLRRYKLPNQEYEVDLKTVMDQVFRILQAMLDIVVNYGWLSSTIRVINIMQMLVQGQTLDELSVLTLPKVTKSTIPKLKRELTAIGVHITLSSITHAYLSNRKEVERVFKETLGSDARHVLEKIQSLPITKINISIHEVDENNKKEKLKEPYNLQVEKEYEFRFSIFKKTQPMPNIQLGQYTKSKQESWIICIGLCDSDEVLCIKRVLLHNKNSNVSLKVNVPSKPGNYAFSVFFMSDSYLGLDQQFEIPVLVSC